MSNPRINGYCPACGAPELVMDYATANLRCDAAGCPRPDAAHEILQDAQTEHVVTFTEDGFNLKHPVRERINDDLLQCGVHRWIAQHNPGLDPGRYRVILDGPGSWLTYEEMDHV